MYVVYNTYDNLVKIKVSDFYRGVKRPFRFEGATSVQLELPSIPQTISSGIDWSIGDGVVEMDLGAAGLTPGTYPARLVVFDPLHPNGQSLVHEDVHRFQLRVV